MPSLPRALVDRWSFLWGSDFNPALPWWRWTGISYRRIDGRLLTRMDPTIGAAMVQTDREHPMPVPPPMPGQVWVSIPTLVETLVLRCVPAGFQDDVWRVWFGPEPVASLVCPRAIAVPDGSPVHPWPPPRSVLVAGPSPIGLPWASGDLE
jgi:hypothetical protein